MFKVYKMLLERAATFFDEEKLFETFTAEQKIIILENVDTVVFGLFREYVYDGIMQSFPTLAFSPQSSTELN